jgi:alanine dehydrogenase
MQTIPINEREVPKYAFIGRNVLTPMIVMHLKVKGRNIFIEISKGRSMGIEDHMNYGVTFSGYMDCKSDVFGSMHEALEYIDGL